jgi:hypothetical protein
LFHFGVFKNVSIEARLLGRVIRSRISLELIGRSRISLLWGLEWGLKYVSTEASISPSRVFAANLRQICGETAANRVLGRVIPSENEQETFSFGFLLILDEGGLREGRVKTAYSSLAATES